MEMALWDISEDGKRWRWLHWIFQKMEKGEDGISGPTPKVSSKIYFLFSFPDDDAVEMHLELTIWLLHGRSEIVFHY